MVKRFSRRWRIVAVPAIFLIVFFCGLASVNSSTDTVLQISDIVLIDLPQIPGGDKMPAVPFFHDRHTQALGQDKDCSACHLQEKERFVFKFKRLKDGTTETDMGVYHDNCIACHKEVASAGKKSGPLSGDCRSCHTQDPPSAAAWQPIVFDKSLHFRHVSAKTIPPGKMYEEANCSACHHTYDEVTKKAVYKKGTEESCLYCHKKAKTDLAPSVRTASHSVCVSCHQLSSARSKKSGPVQCAGCHDAVQQKKIKIVDNIQRLERNQPDTVLLASWMALSDASDDTMKKQMNPVAFNHVVHEQKADSCRACHHETLKRCAECHTKTGDKKGGKVQLALAMHNTGSTHSCIGCHNQAKTATKECAGCHASMPRKSFAQNTCTKCHTVDKSLLGPFPMQKDATAQVAADSIASHPRATTSLGDDQIPERVKIDGMVNQFEAVDFPHRQIVRAITARIKDNKMAAFFHGDDVTLCAGCHHNAPATLNPTGCASCHVEAFKNVMDAPPGLKGAYHGQCIGCHQAMGIEEPAATDCVKCHKKKG